MILLGPLILVWLSHDYSLEPFGLTFISYTFWK
jgi:hypothetical protein